MTEHQCGDRQGCKAIGIPVLTAWKIEIFTLACHNVAFTECDAKACYDRVILIISVLAQI
eukprot:5565070-Ditylum_brightwellii.AAC.1